jgi:hypothetical protein
MTTNWDSLTRIGQDKGFIKVDEAQSRAVGEYAADAVGTHQCETLSEYTSYVQQPGHMYKQFRSACRVDGETQLRNSELTNPRLLHSLATRPYNGSFRGPGTRPDETLIDKETSLIFSADSREGLRNVRTSLSADAAPWWILPLYGHPQRERHIIPPAGWVRGGQNTRDDVRRVDYEKLLKSKQIKP